MTAGRVQRVRCICDRGAAFLGNFTSVPILQDSLPADMREAAQAPLPRMQPVRGAWLRFDEAYAAQLALRRQLIADRRAAVIGETPTGRVAAQECLATVLAALPEGFTRRAGAVRCPDGTEVVIDRDDPFASMGRILQQDICILEKQGDEHVLTGAVLCFPASWTLAEKLGHPLTRIHVPVAPYDAGVAARVQRLFDGIRPGVPIWRANLLRYDLPDLHQPRTENDPRPVGGPDAPYLRSEHQTLLRLPKTGAVVFAIHTVLVRA